MEIPTDQMGLRTEVGGQRSAEQRFRVRCPSCELSFTKTVEPWLTEILVTAGARLVDTDRSALTQPMGEGDLNELRRLLAQEGWTEQLLVS